MNSEDERLGSDEASAANRKARDTWVNRRMSRAAGWTEVEWDTFLETGRYPKHNEELHEGSRGPIY